MSAAERRVVEVLRGNAWTRCPLSDLKVNETFRMFEDEERNEPVIWDGATNFVVLSPPQLVKDSWQVNADKVNT